MIMWTFAKNSLTACVVGLLSLVSAQQSKAQPLTPAQERALKPQDSFKECGACPEMVVVPAGSFNMGSPASEKGRYDDEGPQHRVTFAKPFAVGKFEVTVHQFAAFVKDTDYDAGSECYSWNISKWEKRAGLSWRNPGFSQSESHPSACLNWHDAKAYVEWLAKKTGKQYRLLSEAEWEYAARAGTATRYYFGDNENTLCGYGNGPDQRAKQSIPGARGWTVVSCDDGYAYTAPVGTFSANDFGLHDVHGNVREWVEDCWNGKYSGVPTDGSARTAGECNRRVLRGGSWANYPRNLRSAIRDRGPSDYRSDGNGLRVVRMLAP
jgi:formylglycine-generating enzyme required for sulfatase activity